MSDAIQERLVYCDVSCRLGGPVETHRPVITGACAHPAPRPEAPNRSEAQGALVSPPLPARSVRCAALPGRRLRRAGEARAAP